MLRVQSNQHYQHRANQKLRSWANAVFQNRGVCGQAFPSLPSPSPVIPFFSRPNVLDELVRKRLLRRLISAIFALLLASTKICSIRPKAANSKQTNRIYDVQHVNATLRTNWNFSSLVWRVLLNNNNKKKTTYQLPEEAQKHFLVYSESGTPKNNANTNSSLSFPFSFIPYWTSTHL